MDYQQWLNEVVPEEAKEEKKLKLTIENEHLRDKFIFFRESDHKYFILDPATNRPVNDLISITTLISKYHEEFDPEANYEKNVASWSKKPSSEYHGKTLEEVKEMWQDGQRRGTFLHRQIELFLNDALEEKIYSEHGNEEAKKSVEFNHFLNFFNKRVKDKLIVYRTEWRIFSAKHRISGTIDAVVIPNKNKPNEVVILDWKRTKNIYKYGFNNKKMLQPLNSLDDCNFVHYSLQLNSYKKILEEFYGLKVIGMYLVIFHPNNFTFEPYLISSDYKRYVDEIFTLRNFDSPAV